MRRSWSFADEYPARRNYLIPRYSIATAFVAFVVGPAPSRGIGAEAGPCRARKYIHCFRWTYSRCRRKERAAG